MWGPPKQADAAECEALDLIAGVTVSRQGYIKAPEATLARVKSSVTVYAAGAAAQQLIALPDHEATVRARLSFVFGVAHRLRWAWKPPGMRIHTQESVCGVYIKQIFHIAASASEDGESDDGCDDGTGS